MKTAIIVHPGSVFTSYAAEAGGDMAASVGEDMISLMAEADNLVVIDGSFSDSCPSDFNRSVAAEIARVSATGGFAARAWGCDAGENPYPGWPGDASLVYSGQAEAGVALADKISDSDEIVLSGAWATRDGSSGCVISVAEALSDLPEMSGVLIRVSESAAYEEDAFDQEPDGLNDSAAP